MRGERIGSGWKRTTPTGKGFVSIAINVPVKAGDRVSMWPSSFKERENQPDYALYLDNYVRPGEQTEAVTP